jgi:hypothetical protein
VDKSVGPPPEGGNGELVGRQQPGDAVQATSGSDDQGN